MPGSGPLLEVKLTQILGKLAAIEATMKENLRQRKERSDENQKRIERLESCPCAVHRDPAHSCAILDVRDRLASIETKLDQKISPIKIKMAAILGAVAAGAFITDVILRLLPYLLRR